MLLAADFYLDIFSSPPTPARVFSAMSLQPAPLSTADAVNPLINKLNPDGLKPYVYHLPFHVRIVPARPAMMNHDRSHRDHVPR